MQRLGRLYGRYANKMRKSLTLLVSVLALTGLGFVFFVAGKSMQPSDKAKSERSQHDLSTLIPGQYRIDKFGRGNAWNEKVLLIRDWDGKIYAYLIPTKDDKVTLPDRFWGWGYYDCSDFRPEVDEGGHLLKDGIIKCHDKDTPEWGASLWQWSYSGKPKDKWGIQMYAPSIEVTDTTLYINR